jgi:hypothetical protein
MLRAFNASVCQAASRRLLWRMLAVSTLAGALALTTTGIEVRAAATATGSVEVSGLSVPVQLSCPGACSFSSSATSTGAIAGVDGTTPFAAEWTQAPLAATIGYVSTCITVNTTSTWRGATVTGGSTATISGVTLVYGGTTYTNAGVTLGFQGVINEGVFASLTTIASITGGPSQIDIYLPAEGAPGAMALIPGSVMVPCPGGVQTFTASGSFLTLG